jgi:hypothetical protein
MALRDTKNTSVLYYSDEPEWSKGIRLSHSSQTNVFIAHDGTEQRILHRESGRKKIEFRLEALSPDDFAVRHFRQLAELRSAVRVPIWPLGRDATYSGGVATLESGLSPAEIDLEVGSIVFLKDSAGREGFHTIDSITDQAITISASPEALNSYSAPTVYPTIFAIRTDGMGVLQNPFWTTGTEILQFSEL